MVDAFDGDEFMRDLFGDFTEVVPEAKPSKADAIRAAASAAPIFAPTNEFEPSDEDILSDPEFVAAQAAAIEAEAAAIAAAETLNDERLSTADLDNARMDIVRQMQKLQAEVDRIEREKRAKTEAIFQARRTANAAKAQAEQAARSIEVVRQNVATRQRLSKTVEQYARIAQNFSWYTGITVVGSDGEDKVIKCLPHQWDASKFLAAAGRAILGDEMGLGKSLSAIAALDLVGSKRTLIVTQAELTTNFLREIKRWISHRKVVNIKGKTKIERNNILDIAGAFEPVVVIVNYEAWRKDLSLIQRLIDFGFDTVIADEAHNVKGTNTGAFEGLSNIVHANNLCPLCGKVMLISKRGDRRCVTNEFVAGQSLIGHAAYAHMTDSERDLVSKTVKNLWMMTGTPILNSPADLYPMLNLIDRLSFPDKSTFLKDYCFLNPDGQWKFMAGGLETLMRKLSGKYLARSLADSGVILPPQDIVEHIVEFADDLHLMQQDVIKQLTENAQIVLSENNKMNPLDVLALITRQRQANVWAADIQVWEHPRDEFGMQDKEQPKIKIFDGAEIQESIKVDKVMDLIMEHSVVEGKRMAVFSQFTGGLEEIKRRCDEAGIRAVIYDGRTPAGIKQQVQMNFDKSQNEAPKWEIVLCNYRTGGTGLNLTAATHTIILDEEWNPGKRNQAYKRTQRMGQDENTIVHVIRLAKSVDVWLKKLIDRKEEMIKGFDSATLDIQQELLSALTSKEIDQDA